MKITFKRMSQIVCLTLLALIVVGCGNQNADNVESEVDIVTMETIPTVTIKVKDYGTITGELYPEMAPNTVNNFITLANSGFYDGLIFHRVIDGFMIQGGDPDGIGTGGPGYKIVGEFFKNGHEQNTLSHVKGTISMARGNAPDSAGSQFFIMAEDATYLDGQYAAFGTVTDGMDVVEEIEKTDTDDNNKPLEDIIIESVRVDTNGVEVPEVIKIVE